MAFQFAVAQPVVAPRTNYEAIKSAGLLSGLQIALDAGDIASVASSSQTKWLDVSGGGYDFFRGADVTATTDDPTFNGTPGNNSSSEYWSFDGGDFFRYDSTNETFMQSLHKDNAALAYAAWVYLAAGGQTLFGTDGGGTGTGTRLNMVPGTAQGFFATNTGSLVYNGNSDSVSFASGSWHFVAMRLDEASNTMSLVQDSHTVTNTCTYSSPASGNASYTMEIGAAGNAASKMLNGSRIANFALWQGTAPSLSKLIDLFALTRGKFGV
jgi:hypothetical protein